MKLTLNKSNPLRVKDQIKRQIKGLIESGSLKTGTPLPPSRDLALTLGVNRNTTWAAYRELVKEGWLNTTTGSGTYVNQMKPTVHREDIGKLFDELLSKAATMGYGPNEVTDRFLSHLACQSAGMQNDRLLVVECNHETGLHMAACLERELNVSTETMLIQEIEENPRRALRRLKTIDLVVCGFNHLEEFKAALPDPPIAAMGILMRPDLKAMEILSRLPAGTTVGLTCANRRSTETLFREVIYDNGSTLKRIWAGMNDAEGIRDMLKTCTVVLASHYVYERVKAIADRDVEIIKVALVPDPAGITMVREYLASR
ncbi:putative transcriptional regulator [Desulfosarcina cetonica]|uniref:GntR family transcriptional regulator n=1 Tax=Desulfosarcina cetonica TaxID=90730 RepID=UPI0006D1BDC1|nr:GntR family transcriptional regulator [Desulfosarcina cetonica]VTR67020.1 putative transcriptional regulator [Desulfosarcina cetonica]